MRSEIYLPLTSDRQQYQRWIDAGSKDSWKRAEEVALQLISGPAKQYVLPETDQQIRKLFPDLVLVEEGAADCRTCAGGEET